MGAATQCQLQLVDRQKTQAAHKQCRSCCAALPMLQLPGQNCVPSFVPIPSMCQEMLLLLLLLLLLLPLL
jgi:hypothetical protein